jgi:hypothetical protein
MRVEEAYRFEWSKFIHNSIDLPGVWFLRSRTSLALLRTMSTSGKKGRRGNKSSGFDLSADGLESLKSMCAREAGWRG